MVEVSRWQDEQMEAIVARTVAVLSAGGLVGFPTETVYGVAANALDAAALDRLARCKGRPEAKPFTLAICSAEEAHAWAPELGKLGERLARRAWPGPVTLVVDVGTSNGRLAQVPDAVRERLAPTGSLGLRVPAHVAILDVLDRLPGPLALTSANRSGAPDATTAAEVQAAVGEAIELLIDAGPALFGRPSTVVRLRPDGYDILREGVLPAAEVERLTHCQVLFVCTGNTCRSPLAEGLCKKLLAERLGCTPEALETRGFSVRSAGVSAMMECGPSEQAVVAAQAHGVELAAHLSQPLTETLLLHADYVFAMTQSHLRAVQAWFGAPPGRLELLAPDGSDIADPIGGDQEVYDRCAEQIRRCLEQRVPMLEP